MSTFSWQSHTGALAEGRVEVGEVRLPDGQYATFRWRPQLDEHDKPIPQTVLIDTKHLELPFALSSLPITIEAPCLAYRFDGVDTEALEDPRRWQGRLVNPYRRDYAIRFVLRSQPYAPEEMLAALKPGTRDELLIEACLNYKLETLERHKDSTYTLSPMWVALSRHSVRIIPKLESLAAHGNSLRVRASGPTAMCLTITETDSTTGHCVSHEHTLESDEWLEVPFRHPSRLRRLQVEASLRAEEFFDVRTIEVPPRLELRSALRHGFAWAARFSRNPRRT